MTRDLLDITAAEMLEAGYIGSTDALVQVRELAGDPHSGSGGRAYAITLAGGLAFEVLPDRGLDIGAAWFANQPIAWRSPLGSPGLAPTPSDWLGRFGGGLLVTCGLDNIGSPRGGYGQHGSHHDTRAHDVAVQRVTEPDRIGIRITGTIDSVEVFGRRVRTYRTITSYADDPAVHISDRVVNEGAWPASVALLYHLNFGAPMVLPGTAIAVDSEVHESRDPEPATGWEEFPGVSDVVGETVWEHAGFRTVDGVATASLTSPTGLAAGVSWGTAELPRLFEWIFPPRQSWALGIEPANAPLFGPDRDAPDAGIPILAPGESFTTTVTVHTSWPLA